MIIKDIFESGIPMEFSLKPGEKKIILGRSNREIANKIKRKEEQKNDLHYDLNWDVYFGDASKIKNAKKQIIQIRKEISLLKKEILEQKRLEKESIDKFSKFILKNCSKVIKEYIKANKVLYRGMNINDAKILHGRSWEKRSPLDSTTEGQNAFDKMVITIFQKKQNIPIKNIAVRSNSIFTSPGKYVAGGYGFDLAVIFPINNKFTFMYSKNPNCGDLVLHSGFEESYGNMKVTAWLKAFFVDIKKLFKDLSSSKIKEKFINNSNYLYNDLLNEISRIIETGYDTKNLLYRMRDVNFMYKDLFGVKNCALYVKYQKNLNKIINFKLVSPVRWIR